MSKFRSDKMIDGRPERERVEDFCGAFVTNGANRMQAYRLSYVVDKTATTKQLWARVNELLADPEVQHRIQEMRDEAAVKEIVTVRDILQDLHDIATADPNELISVNIDACRHCHGIDHAYQWTNEQEWARACDNAVNANIKAGKEVAQMPDMAGGFGYHPELDPSPTCPVCFGRGQTAVIAHDSRKVSAKAAKLYRGAKLGANGQMEILLHDQMKARELVGKVLGVFKDGVPVTAVEPAKEAVKPATQEDASKAYLRLIQGGG